MTVILRTLQPDGTFNDYAALTNKDIQSIARRVQEHLLSDITRALDMAQKIGGSALSMSTGLQHAILLLGMDYDWPKILGEIESED